jgi:hypothetical protein
VEQEFHRQDLIIKKSIRPRIDASKIIILYPINMTFCMEFHDICELNLVDKIVLRMIFF